MWGPNSAREVVTTTKDYLTKLYALGAAEDFDSIAIHPYANNAELSVAQLESARRLMNKHGDREAGMWVTEIGWAARGPCDNPYVKGLNGQARVLDPGAVGVQAQGAHPASCAACSGTRGATRRAASRSATGAATPA